MKNWTPDIPYITQVGPVENWIPAVPYITQAGPVELWTPAQTGDECGDCKQSLRKHGSVINSSDGPNGRSPTDFTARARRPLRQESGRLYGKGPTAFTAKAQWYLRQEPNGLFGMSPTAFAAGARGETFVGNMQKEFNEFVNITWLNL